MRPESLLGYKYWVDYCHTIFGIDLQINRTIAEFSGSHTKGSNTIFTNGAEDPWQWATELNPIAQLNQVGLMSNCDDCGHCVELYTPKETDPKAL